MTGQYLKRVADAELARKMSSSGAVLIDGPKACGKTETASRIAQSVIRLDVDTTSRQALEAAPELLFGSQPPILFDEWQVSPTLWNLVRRAVDDRAPATRTVPSHRFRNPK